MAKDGVDFAMLFTLRLLQRWGIANILGFDVKYKRVVTVL